MMEHIIDNLLPAGGVQEYLIVTNAKFVRHFTEWAADYTRRNPTFSAQIINDHSTSDETKLGAIGDIYYTSQQVPIQDDLVVVGGDNLFSDSLTPFLQYAREKAAPVLAVHDIGDLEAIKKYSSIHVDDHGQITSFEEKPQHPTSTLTGSALYYYPQSAVRLLDTYIAEGNNPDQPGRFIQWLYPRMPVFTWKLTGLWYDIGSKESLAEADRLFTGRGQ